MKNETSFEHDILQTQLVLYDKLAQSESLDETAMAILQTMMDFHDGDWAGILSVDLNMKLWKLRWWISKSGGPMGKTIFDPIEGTEIFSRWEACLRKHEPIIIRNREDIRESHPDEYNFLKVNKLHSVIAFPFYQGNVGCILVRNPKKYQDRSELLSLLWRVISDLISQKKYEDLVRENKNQETRKDHSGIQINLLGTPNMDVGGTTIMNGQMLAWETIYYLHENYSGQYSAKELAAILRPQKLDKRRSPKTLRENLFELTDSFESAYGRKEPLVVSTKCGYCINTDLAITYDYELFLHHLQKAKSSRNIYDKLEHLQNAIHLYRGRLFNGKAEGPSQLGDESQLHSAFLVAMEEFLQLLFRIECFDKAKLYATRGLTIEHAYPQFHAAKYIAEVKLFQRNSAWDTFSYAKSVLDGDERQEMAKYILEQIPEWSMVDMLIEEDIDD